MNLVSSRQGLEMLFQVQFVLQIGQWEQTRNFNSNATSTATARATERKETRRYR